MQTYDGSKWWYQDNQIPKLECIQQETNTTGSTLRDQMHSTVWATWWCSRRLETGQEHDDTLSPNNGTILIQTIEEVNHQSPQASIDKYSPITCAFGQRWWDMKVKAGRHIVAKEIKDLVELESCVVIVHWVISRSEELRGLKEELSLSVTMASCSKNHSGS